MKKRLYLCIEVLKKKNYNLLGKKEQTQKLRDELQTALTNNDIETLKKQCINPFVYIIKQGETSKNIEKPRSSSCF